MYGEKNRNWVLVSAGDIFEYQMNVVVSPVHCNAVCVVARRYQPNRRSSYVEVAFITTTSNLIQHHDHGSDPSTLNNASAGHPLLLENASLACDPWKKPIGRRISR